MLTKSITILLLLAAAMTSCGKENTPPAPTPEPNPEPEAEVIFFDDFDTFDNSVWTKETHPAGWVNEELQSYSPSQVSVGKDGDRSVLILTATRRGDKIVSGRINSKGKKSFKYGVVEASIKLPKTARGLWPAFWMMGDNDKAWPACGEIDVMEMGDAAGMADGTSQSRVNTAIHYGPTAGDHMQQYFAASTGINLQDGNYHIYKAVWSANIIEISVDDRPLHSFDIASNPYFHDNFFILFNLAVGGAFTGITDITGITALATDDSARMMVDWVRITR